MDEQEKKTQVKNEIIDWIDSILFAVFVVSLVFTFLIRSVEVFGVSMQPTLHEGEKLMICNLVPLKKGDIVAIESEAFDEHIIKRIIATEGQSVDIDFVNGIVKVDGVVLDEPYINELTNRDYGGFAEYPVTVPQGCYFVMGDNRNASNDSRDGRVGFVERSLIKGKVLFRFYPINRFNTY